MCYRIKYGNPCNWAQEYPTLNIPCLYAHTVEMWQNGVNLVKRIKTEAILLIIIIKN